MKFSIKLLSLVIATTLSPLSLAAVSAEEAAHLGQDLTPIGAEKAGNAEGTIPEWTGGLSNPPAGYVNGKHLIDPYADEQPIATITPANLDQYRDKLSPGQLAMFKRYPQTYKMLVYPSRRSAAFPDDVFAKVKANATSATLVDDGNGVEGYQEVIPFPIPKNGLEVVWNHIMRYRGGSLSREVVQAIVQTGGDYHLVHLDEQAIYPSKMEGLDPESDANISVFFMQQITAPARLTGNVLLVHDTVNQVKQPRSAWVYNAGQRRVRRAPQVAYDGPGTAADGLRTSDNYDLFSGAPDRYNWELVGKQELYIPYNSFKLASDQYKYDDIIKTGHMNPELLRYELHRVWKVEAKLKEGERHIYGRRTFYIDEDTWQIAVADHYDNRGEIWRLAEAYEVQYYYADTPLNAGQSIFDLISGRYLVLGLENESPHPTAFGITASKLDFTPAALRRSGKK